MSSLGLILFYLNYFTQPMSWFNVFSFCFSRNASMPSTTSWVVYGLMKLPGSTETAVAPAIINSKASSALAIPPFNDRDLHRILQPGIPCRTATGFTAGPDIPPVFFLLAQGARVLQLISIFIPPDGIDQEATSAPPLSAARAISVMSVTFGAQLHDHGLPAYFHFFCDCLKCPLDSWPKAIPPSFTLGPGYI